MGGCASIHHHHPPSLPGKHHNRSQQILLLLSTSHRKSDLPPPKASRRRFELVRVICEDGMVEELNPPVTAAQAVAKTGDGGTYLCSWESMYVDACAQEFATDEDLKPGQVYFTMPKSMANQALALHEMCGLAIEASSGLSLQDFHSSFRR